MTTPLLQHIQQNQHALLTLAKQHGVSNIRVVGSVARGEERPDSDIDLLVDFDSKHFSLFDLGGFQYDATELLGRYVDVIMSSNKMHPVFIESIVQDAISLQGNIL